MSRRRRTPDLVATVTGAEPREAEAEAAAPVEAPKRRRTTDEQTPPADRQTGRTTPARAVGSARSNATRGRQKGAAAKNAEAEGNAAPRWSAEPKRSNFTFRLSEEVSDELERLIMALRFEHGIRASRSEIAEVALQVAVEDAGSRGEKSDVVKRLSGKLRRRHDGDAAKSASK